MSTKTGIQPEWPPPMALCLSSPCNSRWKSSDNCEGACSGPLDSLNGKSQESRFDAIGASLRERSHIRLRCPVPNHAACIEVSAFAHCLARRIVVQQFDCRSCDSVWVLKGNQRSAPI